MRREAILNIEVLRLGRLDDTFGIFREERGVLSDMLKSPGRTISRVLVLRVGAECARNNLLVGNALYRFLIVESEVTSMDYVVGFRLLC